MIDVDALLKNHFHGSSDDTSNPLVRTAASVLKKLAHQDEINQFIETNQHLDGLEFNDAVLEHFNFSFQVSNKDRAHIPDQDRLLIVANHPLGSLDGMALLKLVSEIRTDVKIVADSLLCRVDPLKSVFLSIDHLSGKIDREEKLRPIVAALEAEQAVILFPTEEVSRIRPSGVRDGKWRTDFLHLAKKTKAPIVPVFIGGKNSALYYGLSGIYKPLGTMMLLNEMFSQKDGEVLFRIGKPIPWASITELNLSKKAIAERMRKQVYWLAKKKKPSLFRPIENIIHPARTKLIRKELRASEWIGKTQDGKFIYLFDYIPNSSVMREIGRLRELSFRQVQEGTGNALDIDSYDRYYRHLILWDEEELEIIGSYRIGEAWKIIKNKGEHGLYTRSLFNFRKELIPYLENAIELGRSFIQPRYQGKRSLDYLWQGIGAYLSQHPAINFMIGPVSLSHSYPEAAQTIIASFYTELFGCEKTLVDPAHPFNFAQIRDFAPFKRFADDTDYKRAFAILKEKLAAYGVGVPILYKQYVELCNPGGCEFLSFNIDPKFSSCVDALILVHVSAIKEKKRQRYIENHMQMARNMNAA